MNLPQDLNFLFKLLILKSTFSLIAVMEDDKKELAMNQEPNADNI